MLNGKSKPTILSVSRYVGAEAGRRHRMDARASAGAYRPGAGCRSERRRAWVYLPRPECFPASRAPEKSTPATRGLAPHASLMLAARLARMLSARTPCALPTGRRRTCGVRGERHHLRARHRYGRGQRVVLALAGAESRNTNGDVCAGMCQSARCHCAERPPANSGTYLYKQVQGQPD